MPIDEENPLVLAALVFLHREAARVAEIRLTKADFAAHGSRLVEGIQFKYDLSTGDVILLHVKPAGDA
jgi:hypothetical protein